MEEKICTKITPKTIMIRVKLGVKIHKIKAIYLPIPSALYLGQNNL